MTVKILAVDTATENCSVALLVGDEVYSRSALAAREHTTRVLPMVDEVLKEAGITLKDVDALAFGQGPGSFTGVRIGIGIAQGLAFGADLPMIGVSTLEAMAQACYRLHGKHNVLAAIDARMSEIYFGQYQRAESGDWQAVVAEAVVAPDVLALSEKDDVWSLAGTGWSAYPELASSLGLETEDVGILYPEAQDMAVIAKRALAEGKTVVPEEAAPVYLRDTVAWKKLPGRE
ncbi:tRNA (adenosine(37)-N6)-threonylcarbamoyltransferase complex dimerization subunit type 1 TsaB [Parasalinivibrio latis]|uniref:tRNA (adenosine(37)-N6)-threonylcarbamoyltransferase complex dimerization subunit type 1 TsaB n=1 Tax=Parasalinivibrio latis TaxID=2952610 RepID=UPI0030E5714F